jgi:hypothetical protein
MYFSRGWAHGHNPQNNFIYHLKKIIKKPTDKNLSDNYCTNKWVFLAQKYIFINLNCDYIFVLPLNQGLNWFIKWIPQTGDHRRADSSRSTFTARDFCAPHIPGDSCLFLYYYFKNIFGPVPLFIFFNTQTMHIKSVIATKQRCDCFTAWDIK